jgi:hypothetical protein
MVGPEETTCESLNRARRTLLVRPPEVIGLRRLVLESRSRRTLMSDWARTAASTTFGAVGTSTHGEMVTSAARTGEVCA